MIVAQLGLLFGCASDVPSGKTEAEVLYRSALQQMDDGRYLLATEKLNTIKSQYPYSFYSTHAELLLADILFLQEEFVEAAAAYLLFRDMHPRHKKIVYVVWKIGESYYYQLPDTFDRDLSSAVEAIKYYKEIINKYSKSKHVTKAKSKIAFCRKMLRSKEQYIADFYFKTDEYQAARFRYLMILDSFLEPNLQEHAKIKIVESSMLMKNYDDCLKYAKKYLKEVSSEGEKIIQATYSQCQELKSELSKNKDV